MALFYCKEDVGVRVIRLFLALLLIGVSLLFVAQNFTLVEVSFFNYRGYTPVFVLVLISMFLGFLIAFFYFLPKEIRLKAIVDNLREGTNKLNSGFFHRAEQSFQKDRSLEPLLCLSFYERDEANRLLDLKSPFSAHMLLKLHFTEQAEERFKKILQTDPENLLALKGMRDISFIKGDVNGAVDYQEKVLKLCEKWDRENQKKIMAEILASLWKTRRDPAIAERAFELYRTPLTYSARISSLLSLGKDKEALRLFEKSFEENLQNEVLMMLSEEETTLTKLMDLIQRREQQIGKTVLLLTYLRLGLFSKAKSLLDEVPNYYRCLATLFMSHREEDRACARSLEEVIYPWECVCGVRYKEYTPLCPNCLKWNKLKLKTKEG